MGHVTWVNDVRQFSTTWWMHMHNTDTQSILFTVQDLVN